MKIFWIMGAAVCALAACGQTDTNTAATDAPTKAAETSATELAGRTAGYSADKNAYFGDLHIHTKNSFDAYIFNVRTTPDDVYRFAKGQSVRHPSGFDIKIWGEPLDFVAATDHGAYMGVLPAMNTKGTELSKLEMAKDMFSTDPEKITAAFGMVGGSIRSGIPIEGAYDKELISKTWQDTVAVADKHYKPGKLTTFAAYEYTSVTMRPDDESFAGGNLHRNVVFKDAAPKTLFSTLNSTNPEDLWSWMDEQRADGRDVMAIPHNSNVSDGKMFDSVQYDGSALSKEWAEKRIRNEPIVEMTQVKGTSETHPAMSPNDEFANFEIYEKLLSSQITSKIKGSYVREALSNGLDIERRLGANPYKFGMIGASDSHVVGGAFDEKDYWSKVGILDGTAEGRGSVPPGGAKTWDGVARDVNAEEWFTRWAASGLAGVWAEENTRESIYDAMARKETFATSGPRMKVRFFASHDFGDIDVNSAELTSQAYASGVPMGGDIDARDSSPTFLAWAMRDPLSAPLQRVQVVKAWFDDGKPQEAVYDIACSDGGTPDAATHRCPDNGASVDLTTCEASAGSGAPELRAAWKDPAYDSSQSATYYARVIENPTCRWSTWDALKAGVERHPDLPATLQERAWTSPIWVNAK
ncbi:MAG: DUF3604 domain-containing protein [Maricaulaceae bacterium]